MTDGRTQIRVIAFVERSALQVYIANESPALLRILNDLDSINIPPSVDRGSEESSDANLIHIDFGVSESVAFVQVAPGECVKITLLLREEQSDLLARVKHMKTAVKFRSGGEAESEVTTVLLPATVYRTKP